MGFDKRTGSAIEGARNATFLPAANETTPDATENGLALGGPAFDHGVSLTALWVGFYRMVEGHAQSLVETQSPPLFYDPLAKALMGEANAARAWHRMIGVLQESVFMSKAAYAKSEYGWFTVRTRFHDDFVLRSLLEHTLLGQEKNNGARPRQLQVVDLACGFDARAFRLTFPPNTLFFELDRAEVLALKNDRLALLSPQPALTCARRVCIPADIVADDWETQLHAQGFDPSLPTCWLMEGILTYLPKAVALQLLDKVKSLSAPGSTFAFDGVNGPMQYTPNMQNRLTLLRDDDAQYNLFLSRPEAFMGQAGFPLEHVRVHFVGDPAASYGRVGPCVFLQAMRIVIRVVIAVLYLGAGLLLGLFVPWYIALPALVVLLAVGEGWAWRYHEWLARQLKLSFFPSTILVEAKV